VRGEHLAGELDDDELGRLGTDARDPAERRVVVGADRVGDLRDGERREHAESRLRPDAGDSEKLGEDRQLVALLEAEERQRILADDQVRVQHDRLAQTCATRHLRRHGDRESDSADLDHDRILLDMQHGAAD
jgi:hypothetical protein